MIDRRMLIAGLAAGLAAPAVAAPLARKRQAIEAIPLPAGFSGVLAFAREGRVAHLRCAGMADIEAARPVTAGTRFKWGSASKWLVSTAALRLVEQGRLSLDAPVTAHLPSLRRDAGDRVLVRHLLSNTSGIPDRLSPALRADPAMRGSTASAIEIATRFATGDLAFAPGAGWDYSPLNWVIVAALLEQLSGEPLPALVARSVLRPLGMTATGFAQADQPPMPDLAAAYAGVAPPVRKMLPIPPFLAASGNVAGTAADAARAAHGIFHGPLLSRTSRDALTTVRWPDQDYALGGRIHLIDGERWAWETGKVEGYRAHIAHRLARSETVVILNATDLDQPTIGTWAELIARA